MSADIDAKAICREALDGSLDDASARNRLWALIARATVEQVARSACSNPATAERVADRLEIVVTTALLEGSYDFERGLDSSFDGWVRRYAAAALLGAVRDTLREERRNGIPKEFGAWQEYQPVWRAIEEDGAELFLAYCDAKGNLRPARKLQLDAATLRALYGLPCPGRPYNRDERHALLDRFEGDPEAAISSLRAWLRHEDDAASVLWDEFHHEQVRMFLEECKRPGPVVSVIARAAVADYPRPTRKLATQMRRRIADELGAEPHFRILVDSWIEDETDAVMDHVPSRESRENQAKGAILQRRRFTADLARAAESAGVAPDRIHDLLRATAEKIDLFSISFQEQ